ncbi:hypothetical protein OKW21_003491 [Catalinimonas alkaloidigena]|uniref:hypothetical protein n=1 Tax=Catalinimonas alkaloidigena TaxID=1075417 RepID=UPI002405F682|nr:hypothetical protein [Catalinimonas alkaloidigena]MDF9798228.1 hypothetical protein [Catalinimonas alkaloidigena]
MNINIDYSYVEEVFESRDEYRYFLQIISVEFEEAINKLVLSIEQQDIHSFRKTLHNVMSHLEMLRANELCQFLEQVKPQISGAAIDKERKAVLIHELGQSFDNLLVQVKSKYEELSEAS